MKIISLVVMVVVFSTLLVGCAQTEDELSELQVTACNSADEAGTCDTKLPELGIVTTGKCCEILGKCC